MRATIPFGSLSRYTLISWRISWASCIASFPIPFWSITRIRAVSMTSHCGRLNCKLIGIGFLS